MTSRTVRADLILRSLLERVERPDDALFDDGPILQTVRHIVTSEDPAYECAVIIAGLADTAADILGEFLPLEVLRDRLHQLIVENATGEDPTR